MLKHPDGEAKERLIVAFTHLQVSEDWQTVQAWLDTERTRLTEQLVSANDDQLRGAIRTLRVLLTTAAEAREHASKIRLYRDKTAR